VLHTDPIVLDAFTHLLGCWGIDKKAGPDGDVIFPLRLEVLTLHGNDPPEGASVECRIRVREVSRYRVKVDAELVTEDDRVWVTIQGWEDWRFYWPGRYRDVFRQPDRVLVGEPLDLPDAGPTRLPGMSAVWLQPPADMARPVWRDVLEWVQLGPEERAAMRSNDDGEAARTLRTWGVIAAKEAARRTWLALGGDSVFPADLVVEKRADGRPVLRSLIEMPDLRPPEIAIATTDGVALAIACAETNARVGATVELIAADADIEAVRSRCASVAVGRALGDDCDLSNHGPIDAEFCERRIGERILHAGSATREGYVWAWAVLHEGGSTA
jgi:hypothetical protein